MNEKELSSVIAKYQSMTRPPTSSSFLSEVPSLNSSVRCRASTASFSVSPYEEARYREIHNT